MSSSGSSERFFQMMNEQELSFLDGQHKWETAQDGDLFRILMNTISKFRALNSGLFSCVFEQSKKET